MVNILYFFVPTVLCGAPPSVDNAFLIGRKRSHYDIHSVVRYQCADGFLQRHVPTAKCRANGKWDRPKIICIKCEFLYDRIFTKYDGTQQDLKQYFHLLGHFHICISLIFCMHTTLGQPPTLSALGSYCHHVHSGFPSLLSLLMIASKEITRVAD